MRGLRVAMDDLEHSFTAWAERRDDIRAAIVVGSRARADHPADEWADLDVGFLTNDPKRYHASQRWLSEIAPVWTMYRDHSGPTYHVLFEGGLDAGIAVLPARVFRIATRVAPMLQRAPLPSFVRNRIDRELSDGAEYYRRGVRVLIDKDNTAARFFALFPGGEQTRMMPSPITFQTTIDEFWFVAVWTAKHLWRGELWHARQSGCDGELKSLLLRMIEWHAWATHGPQYETWSGGRFLEEWADRRVLSGLETSFAAYDATSIARALDSTMTLFAWLSAETAKVLGYDYSQQLATDVMKWIQDNAPAAS